MPKTPALLAFLVLAGAPAWADDPPACSDANKCAHWASVKATYPKSAALGDRDLTQDLVGDPDSPCDDVSTQFIEAAPDTCSDRINIWAAMERILKGGDEKAQAAIKKAKGKGNRFASAYFLAWVEHLRFFFPSCTEEKKKKKDPYCTERADKFLAGVRALTPPPNWLQAKGIADKDKIEPCLWYDYGMTAAGGIAQPIEVVPSVWGGPFSVTDTADGGAKKCVSLEDAAKAAGGGSVVSSVKDVSAMGIGLIGGKKIDKVPAGIVGWDGKPYQPKAQPAPGAGLSNWDGTPYVPPKKKKNEPPPSPGITTKYE